MQFRVIPSLGFTIQSVNDVTIFDRNSRLRPVQNETHELLNKVDVSMRVTETL